MTRAFTCGAALLLACAPLGAAAHGFGDLEVVGAIDALDAGDDARARELLQHFLAGPYGGRHRAEARLLAARAAQNLGEPAEALGLLTGIERDLPEIADLVRGERARALRAAGRWAEARDAWTQLVAEHPDSPLVAEARYGVADAALALGRIDEAQAAYELAIRGAPRSDYEPTARFNLARIAEGRRRWVEAAVGYRYIAFYRVGDPVSDLARERLERLVAEGRAAPPDAWQQLSRIDVLLSSRSLDEAEAALAAVATQLKTASQRTAHQYRLGKLAYRRRDFDGALRIFTDLAARSSGRDRLDYAQWVARTHSTAGRFQEAIDTYLTLAERARRSSEGREALFKAAWLSYNGGNYQQALLLFGEFAERYPRDRAADEALWHMAWNAYRLGDLPTAIGTLERLRAHFPTSGLTQRTHYWQGRFAALMANLPAARAAYGEAVAVDPLTYYGVLAAQRVAELELDVAPVVFARGASQLALADDAALPELEARAPSRDELPEFASLSLVRAEHELPWGGSVFDWQTPVGRRLLTLVRLGLRSLAADLVPRLVALPGRVGDEVSYARARLLYSLGDYNAAYRIAESAFGRRMRARPTAELRRYFQLAYPDAFRGQLVAASGEFSVSPLLILAVMRQESGFDDRARSWASAHGLMQIIPPTGDRIAAALGVEAYNDGVLRDPGVSIRFGAWYLGQLAHKFGNNLPLAIASYNAGPEAVARWVDASPGRALDEFVEDIPFKETRHYVKRVVGNLAVYSLLHGQRDFHLPERVPEQYLNNIDW